MLLCFILIFFLRYKRMTTRKWWKQKHNPCKHVINTGDHLTDIQTDKYSQISLSIFQAQYTRAIREVEGEGNLFKKALCSPKQTWGFLATAEVAREACQPADETPSLGCYY